MFSSAAMAPRSTNTCSVSVMPMLSPATAESRAGALHRSMVFTVLVLLLGEKTSRSPTWMRPLSTRPGEDAPMVEAIHVLDWEAQRLVAG